VVNNNTVNVDYRLLNAMLGSPYVIKNNKQSQLNIDDTLTDQIMCHIDSLVAEYGQLPPRMRIDGLIFKFTDKIDLPDVNITEKLVELFPGKCNTLPMFRRTITIDIVIDLNSGKTLTFV
jgi:hypothetical protein